MKMAKASKKDIEAADSLVQLLEAIDERFGGPHGIYDVPEDLPAMLDKEGVEFDCDNLEHLQALYNHLARLLRRTPNFHGRVISGMCHVILWEKNEILDPDSDTLDLHPKFAKMEAERNELLGLLKLIVFDLPVHRDWLDPQVERAAREAIAKAEGKSDGQVQEG